MFHKGIMVDSPLRPTDLTVMCQPFGRDASLSQTGLYKDRDGRKGQQGTSLPQRASQTIYIQSQKYASYQQPLPTWPESFNFGQLIPALPDLPYQNYDYVPPRYPSACASSGLAYQMLNNYQYAGPQVMSPTRTLYPYQAQYHEVSVAANAPPPTALGTQFYYQESMGPQQQYGSPYFIELSQYGLYSQVYPGSQQPAQFGSRGSFTAESRIPSHQRARGGPGRPSSIGKLSKS
jgi:hypothetical protein